jgi:excinuclease ABC subunit A
MTEYECPDCCGARLKPQTLAVTVGGKNIYELTCMPVQKLLDFLGALRLSKKNAFIGSRYCAR